MENRPEDILKRIRALCKKQGTNVRKLEQEIGLSEGSIGKMRYGRMPLASRLEKIAEALGTSTRYLQTGELETEGYYLDPETARAAQEIFENEELSLLFDAARDASPEDLRTVHQMLLALKRKEESRD